MYTVYHQLNFNCIVMSLMNFLCINSLGDLIKPNEQNVKMISTEKILQRFIFLTMNSKSFEKRSDLCVRVFKRPLSSRHAMCLDRTCVQ